MKSQREKYSELTDCLCTSIRRSARNISQIYSDHLQQSGEKILTAFLYGKGAEDVWGHSLADLSEDAINFDPSFEMIKSVAVLLDKYYYLTRYPSQIPSGISSDIFAVDESEKAIEIAEEVIKFVIDRIDNI